MERVQPRINSRVSRDWFWFWVLLSCVLVLWLLAACLGPVVFGWYSTAVGIFVVTLPAICLLYWVFLWLTRQDLFAPWIAFPISYCLWFCIGSFNLFDDPYPPPYGLIVLGLACYLVGVRLGKLGCHLSLTSQRSRIGDEWPAGRFRNYIVFIAAVTLFAYLLIAIQMGIPGLHSDAGEQRLKLLNYGKSQFVFMCGAWTAIVFLSTRLWSGGRGLLSKTAIWLLIILSSLMVLSLGSRGNLLTPAATVLIARHYIYRRTRLSWAVPLGLGVFVVASLLGWARDTAVYAGTRIGNLEFTGSSYFYLYYYVRNSVTTLRDIVDIIPKAVPYQQGYLSFGALTSLLPGHHVSSDMFFRQILGLDFVGFGQPATLLGPMYGDFGILGIVLQMTILGFAFTRLYYRMLRKGETITALLYAWTSHAILFSLFGSLFTYFILAAVPVGWLLFGKLLRSPDRASGNKLSEAFPSCATP